MTGGDVRPASPGRGGRRVSSLDGLRGLAAAVVFGGHALLTTRQFAPIWDDPAGTKGRVVSAFTYTPLHLLWNGSAAVMVFFVLSGYVLTLPFDGATDVRRRWISYYPRRVVRLYVPVVGALVVAALLAHLVTRRTDPGASSWLVVHATSPGSLHNVLHDALVVKGATWLDSPLWSLRWEVVFSMLLPVFLALAVTWRAGWWLKIALAVVLVGLADGAENGGGLADALRFLPVFVIGSCLAAGREEVARLCARVPARAWWGLLVVALALVNTTWTSRWIAADPAAEHVAHATSTLGAAMLVVMFTEWPPARRLGETGLLQWLGALSFSIYLVHEPIQVSIAWLLGGTANPLVILVVSALVALPSAMLLRWVVVDPSHRLARAVGRRFAAAA